MLKEILFHAYDKLDVIYLSNDDTVAMKVVALYLHHMTWIYFPKTGPHAPFGKSHYHNEESTQLSFGSS